MSFSLRAADSYSLLKSGSLLSACAVIEKFQPSVSLFLPHSFCFPHALSILVSQYDILNFPSTTQTSSLPPFFFSSLSASSASSLYLNSLSSLVWLTPPTPHSLPGRLLSFRTNVADFWSLATKPSAESASSSGWGKKGGESLNRPGRWCESAWHGGGVNMPEHICLGPANMRRAKVITSGMTLWFFLPHLGKERKKRFGCTSHDVKALAWSGTLCLRLCACETWQQKCWNDIKMTNFARELWHLPRRSEPFVLFQLITRCPVPATANVFYWVITSSAPFIVKERIVVDEHSVKQIIAALCAVCPLFFESLPTIEGRCNLAGGECESAHKMERMMMRPQLC